MYILEQQTFDSDKVSVSRTRLPSATRPGETMTEKFLTAQEVAERLGISLHRVRKKIRTHELPGLFDGYKYLIPESELTRWMDEHKIRRQP